jgi:hypothetical protein
MNDAIQKQLGLFYDVQVVIFYQPDTKQLVFANQGRTNVALWGLVSEELKAPPIKEKEGRVISPGASYSLDATPMYNIIAETFPKGISKLVPAEAYLKNERQEEFTVHFYIGINWNKDVTLKITTQAVSVTPEHWSRKYATNSWSKVSH